MAVYLFYPLSSVVILYPPPSKLVELVVVFILLIGYQHTCSLVSDGTPAV